MLFNSFHFLFFFIAVTLTYFALPHRGRWGLLLIASCYFYMCFVPEYILILFFTIAVDYAAGLLIERARGGRRTAYLVLSLLANVGVLAVFKYFNFLNGNLQALAELLNWNYPVENLKLILPIGISFHTFQSMSYTIEVYRGRFPAERHFGVFSLYVLFYPQLVAGPIERPQNLLTQLREAHAYDDGRVMDGLRLMAWGLFKKVAIADRLAVFVDPVYNNVQGHEGAPLLLATVFFAFQIYCDFSGYSDMAVGAAKTMGFRLINNFNHPYASTSIRDFWSRWHISLSTWFRDYLYIPLGGSRAGPLRWEMNILLTFLVSGLWHGANWTFVIWGLLNGFYLLAERWTENFRDRLAVRIGLDRLPALRNFIKVAATFSLTSFAWIFFRAASVSDALYVVTHLTSGLSSLPLRWGDGTFMRANIYLGHSAKDFLMAVAAVLLLETVQTVQRRQAKCLQTPPARREIHFWVTVTALLFGILFFGVTADVPFIYFQF